MIDKIETGCISDNICLIFPFSRFTFFCSKRLTLDDLCWNGAVADKIKSFKYMRCDRKGTYTPYLFSGTFSFRISLSLFHTHTINNTDTVVFSK